jgi:hypothetical protein
MTTPEEAARRIMERDAPAFLVEGKLGSDAVIVARALLAAEARIQVRKETLEAFAESLTWCTENDGECLGDHPKRLAVYAELLAAYRLSAALAKPEENKS